MIFNLFKSKPTLKELIPNGFIDIHSHILPGIDDGAKNIKESKELIDKMNEMGFAKIIGTPHTYQGLYDNTNESIIKSYNLVLDKIPLEIDIGYASEYMLNNSLLDKLASQSILCLKENYILIEMSYIAPPINLYEIIFEIQINKYIPILAHPERYRFLHKDFRQYKKLKQMGCLFQSNLLSFTDFYGRDISKIADKLLKKKMIDFLGSDIHNMKHIKAFEKKIITKDTSELKEVCEKNILFK